MVSKLGANFSRRASASYGGACYVGETIFDDSITVSSGITSPVLFEQTHFTVNGGQRGGGALYFSRFTPGMPVFSLVSSLARNQSLRRSDIDSNSNSALYGPTAATDARLLSLLNRTATEATYQQSGVPMTEGVITVQLLDMFGQVVTSDSSSVAILEVMRNASCTRSPYSACENPTLAGSTTVQIQNGTAAFEGMVVQGQPGCCTVLAIKVGGLESQHVDITLDECDAGHAPSDDNTRCDSCQKGTSKPTSTGIAPPSSR